LLQKSLRDSVGGFERAHLPRRSRLTQVKSRDRSLNAARLHDRYEGA